LLIEADLQKSTGRRRRPSKPRWRRPVGFCELGRM